MIQPDERSQNLVWFAQPAEHLELGERKEKLRFVVRIDVINRCTLTARAGTFKTVPGLFQARVYLHRKRSSRGKELQKVWEFLTKVVYCPLPHGSGGVVSD